MSNEKPKCRCGNTSDPNGYCDGSHLKQTNPATIKPKKVSHEN